MSNINVLTNFILYFKEKALALIREEEKNKIILPKLNINKYEKETNSDDIVSTRFQVKRFYIGQKDTYLSFREAECGYWSTKGKTSTEIAKLLYLSTRTVENHINNVKRKLNVCKQALLSKLLTDFGVVSYFDKD